MPQPISKLLVELLADTKGFSKGFGDAEKKLAGFEKRLKGIGNLAKGAFAAGGVAFVGRELDEAIRKAVEFGDSIDKAAKAAGVSAAALQEYRFAGQLAGNSITDVDNALGRFTRRLGEARRGNTEYIKTFQQLGVTASDTVEVALKKTFNRLAAIKDQALRTSVATKVFGDDARRMALLVEGGAEGLEKMRRKSHALGQDLSDLATKSLAGANDRLSELDNTLRVKLAESVAANIDGFIALKESMNDVARVGISLGGVLGTFAQAAFHPVKTQKGLNELFDVSVHPNTIRNVNDLSEALDNLKKHRADLAAGEAGKTTGGGGGGFTLDPFAGVKKAPAPTLKGLAFGKRHDEAADQIAVAFEKLKTPSQQLREEIEKLQSLGPLFKDDPQNAAKLAVVIEADKKKLKELAYSTNIWKQNSVDAARGISSAFADAIVYGDKLGASLKRLAQQLSSQLIQQFVFKGISTAIGIPIPGLAVGGSVGAGLPYIVGEKGPELFVPSASGRIVPNDALRRAGGHAVTVQVDNHFDVGLESTASLIQQLTRPIAAATTREVLQALARPRHA